MVVVLDVFEEEFDSETASPRSRGGTIGDGVLLSRDIRRGVSGVLGGGRGSGSTRRYLDTLS
jgi:hypothetical protein